MKRKCIVVLLAVIFIQSICAAARIAPAFPGAEGYGANAIGGRGGEVYYVTNLSDSGPGSLRDAISQPHRTVMFKVSGTIELESKLEDWAPYITIAGQTAPGDGICLKNYSISILNTHDIIIRHLRSRAGDETGLAPGTMDSFKTINSYNIMIDHCSFSWCLDENASIGGRNTNTTVQWCIISEGLMPHSAGSLFQIFHDDGYTSLHHNLYAHNNYRTPRVDAKEGSRHYLDWRNNVIYNWGWRSSHSAGNSTVNYVNNYLVAGPDTEAGVYNQAWESWGLGTIFVYFEGNWVNGSAVDWHTSGVILGTPDQDRMLTPFESVFVATDDADVAYQRVLDDAGATLPQRDSVDTRVVSEVINETGGLVRVADCTTFDAYCEDHGISDCEEYCGSLRTVADIGGWPTLNSTTPPQDTDNDGMPDSWENTNGLDLNDANDRNLDSDFDGYTNLEEYLNDTSPSEDDAGFVFVRDDFEDGDFTSEPTWTPYSSCSVELNSPGTSDGNYWAKIPGGHGSLKTKTQIASVGTDLYEIRITGNILFMDDTDSGSNYAAVYLVDDLGTSYIRWIFTMDNNSTLGSFVNCRKSGSDTYSSAQAQSGITNINEWYNFECVWRNDNTYELWVDDNVNGMQLVSSGQDATNIVVMNDFTNIRLYSRSGYKGFDDIYLESFMEQKCGADGTTYLTADINEDCRVDFNDLGELAGDWLDNTDPGANGTPADVLVTDDFEDGDYTTNPIWTVGAGSCSVLRNSPGTTDGNYWALITDSHGNIYTSTNIAPASNYTEVSVEGNIVFGAATSNYSSVYLISSDGLTYVEFRFNVAGNWGDCQVVMRTDGAQLFVSDVVSTSTMMTDEQWYRFKCVWKYDNSYEIWINNGGSTELELALYAKDEYETSYPGLADFERVRLYVRGGAYGYDEIVVEGKYSPFCGGPGTIYSENDTNLDCYVNLADYAILASYWLECSDPNKIECKDIFY